MWPVDAQSLIVEQRRLATADPGPWRTPTGPLRLGACWVCFPRGLTGRGGAGDPAWAAALVMTDSRVVEQRVLTGVAGAGYAAGLLALRIGPLMQRAVDGLDARPDVLLLDATGRDHPRGAGLALHLGAELGVPTVGITHRPLLAQGGWPDDRRGATSLLRIRDTVVACWLRTKTGVRPLVVHAGWQVDLRTAVELVLSASTRRTPEPLRRARQRARRARAAAPAHGVSQRTDSEE